MALSIGGKWTAALVAGLLATASAQAADKKAPQQQAALGRVQHVLLISIDGFHQRDLEVFLASHANSALAQLSAHGVVYTKAATVTPSDSFPGLLAQITGGTPGTTGVFYDDSYSRSLSPPGDTACKTRGTEVAYAENIDFDSSQLDGGASAHGGAAIDPAKLPRDEAKGCKPAYPHEYLRVNTVFEAIKAHKGRTAWADKHPAYDLVQGPSGRGVDDLYTPEIDANSPVSKKDFTKDIGTTEDYDDLKVAAVVNEIRGLDHSGSTRVGVPAIMGLNFQAVSVAQKLDGFGYKDAAGTPSDGGPAGGLKGAIEHTDASVGKLLEALERENLLASTLVIVSAKHGQSPIDQKRLKRIPDKGIEQAVGGNLAFQISDDGTLIWLKDRSPKAVAAAAKALQANAGALGIHELLTGAKLKARFAGSASTDRIPDIVAIAEVGTVYTKGTKIAEHGGFNEDDVHVALLVSNPKLPHREVATPVHTTQIAPTILKSLGIAPTELKAVREEKTRTLPGF
jgi:hypothetical protein